MKSFILATAAATALFAAPAIAQDVAVDASGNVYVLTADQETMLASWPMERQTMYRAWPYNLQEYYWTLDAPRQDGWWMLTDAQRGQVYALAPEQRDMAWTSILAQTNGMASANASMTGMTASGSATMASTMAPRFVAREVVQTTPAATTANVAAGDLPVCSKNQQDGCINSWEKNRTGTRPLGYWPGKPASEMAGKKGM